MARNEQNRGTPLAYCIASEDNSNLVKTFLTAVKKSASTHGYVFCPRQNFYLYLLEFNALPFLPKHTKRKGSKTFVNQSRII